MDIEDDLNDFLKGFVHKNYDHEAISPSKTWKLPEEYQSPDERNQYINITGEASQKYDQVFQKLKEDQRTEHLKPRQLKKHLRELVIDICMNRKDYAREIEKLSGRIDEFLDEIVKPLKVHEVIFKLEESEPVGSELSLPSGKVIPISKEQILDWGVRDDEYFSQRVIKEFPNSSGLLVEEKGTKRKYVADRAREKAENLIQQARLFFLESVYTDDKNLQFDVSDEYAIRLKGQSDSTTAGWSRGDYKSLDTPLPDPSNETFNSVKEFFSEYQDIDGTLKNRFKRSIFWIGESVEMIDYDQKVVSLFIALESVLVTEDERKKGERIAFRMIELAILKGDGKFMWPAEVLQFYEEIRSSVLHGSDRQVANEAIYGKLNRFTRRTLKQAIDLVADEDIKKISKIKDQLYQSDAFDKAVDWLEGKSSKKHDQILSEIN